MKYERDSNFELLRIILMGMIIGIHYLLHSNALSVLTPHHINYYIANILQSLFIISVNCFILISGYYGMRFKFGKLLKLEFQVLFYSLTIFIIFVLLRLQDISMSEVIKSMMPIFSIRWWFITVYITLFIISPYINLQIDKMNKRQYEHLLFILTVLFVILPSIGINIVNVNNGQSLYSFTLLYLVGGYIRRYYSKIVNDMC